MHKHFDALIFDSIRWDNQTWWHYASDQVWFTGDCQHENGDMGIGVSSPNLHQAIPMGKYPTTFQECIESTANGRKK